LEEALARGLKLLAFDPLQEHVHRTLMRIYAAQGRHDAALAQYERCRHELSAQLGVAPQPETEELARAIRANRRDWPIKAQTPAIDSDQGKSPTHWDRPSIAVLPFTNLSGDPQQDYFADGIVEDIISGLTRLHWLFVVARDSSFTFKNKAIDAPSK
jgi:hypothetical protein